MKVALTTTLDGASADDLDAFLSFHRAAGADVVVVGGEQPPEIDSTLGKSAQDSFLHRAPARSQTDLALIAAEELEADWVVPSAGDEFWWPRGESLAEVLSVIPQRYGVVQALVRSFVPQIATDGGSHVATRTIRTSLLGPDGSDGRPVEELLRPVYRVGPNMQLDPVDWTLGGRRVPLRAWYPIEVFCFRASSPPDDERVAAGLTDGSLVMDTRLRDALASTTGVPFPVPSIVDDASYAVECAAVGEVDLVKLDRQIRALEKRIAELEAEFWPSVTRKLRRLARRRR